MGNELTTTTFTTAITVGTAAAAIERYGDDRAVRDIYKEGVKHLVAERVQAAKTKLAMDLATDVHSHALATAERFAHDAYARVEAAGRSPECQAYYESLSTTLTGMYQEHIAGIVQVGVTNIAREAAREVDVPQDKKGWFR